MNQQSGPQDSVVLSYLGLRKAVGYIGITLPVVLAVGQYISGRHAIEPSISHYYYTNMGDVFVGSLCAIGVFLMSTRGYPEPKVPRTPLGQDHAAGILASVFAIGVALVPTSFDEQHLKPQGQAHLVFASLLFFTLAYFCLKLFTRTSGKPTKRKLRRNIVYRACGIAILASMGLIVVAALPFIRPWAEPLHPRFWLESLAIVAFGAAWLIKGEVLLKDKKDEEDRTEQAVRTAAGKI